MPWWWWWWWWYDSGENVVDMDDMGVYDGGQEINQFSRRPRSSLKNGKPKGNFWW